MTLPLKRYLVPAYVEDVEGPTDWLLLGPLVQRLLLHVAAGGEGCEVQNLLAIRVPSRKQADIVRCLRKEAETFDIVFLHADGKGRPDRAREAHVEAVASRAAHGSTGVRLIGVVPVHETEAWALADGDALRRALSTQLDDAALGLPAAPSQVEALEDPKRVLRDVCDKAHRTRRRHRRDAVPRELIGQLVSLDRLRKLSAFRQLESDLRTVLRALRYIP